MSRFPVNPIETLAEAADLLTGCPDEEVAAECAAAVVKARAAVAELVRRSCEMLEQDQCRFATYNSAPHMATAVDNLRAALAKFGGAK